MPPRLRPSKQRPFYAADPVPSLSRPLISQVVDHEVPVEQLVVKVKIGWEQREGRNSEE
jgi:hypothetical protein